MTAETSDHDKFTWDDKYLAQLNALAGQDELTDDLRWPPLKDAIKHLLNKTFKQWPTSSAPIMHPAAALLPPQSSLTDEASTSTASSHGQANGIESAASLSKSPSYSTNGSRSQLEEASSSASPNTATAALALSSRFQREGDDSATGPGASIREADLQAFFPSKRRAPVEWGGSWGKRLETQQAVEEEKVLVFSMLDDFEGQPPFTIQRLSELILRPSEHHHTLAKYVSALKRLLSVTATRDAFPAFGEEGEQEDFDAPSVQGRAINGHSSASSTLASMRAATPVPGSPTTAPLFSPIPFLMKSGDEGMPGKAGSDELMMDDEDVPGMELGGADRTTEVAVEAAKKSGAGAGSGLGAAAAAAASSARATSEPEHSTTASTEGQEKPVPVIRPAPEATTLNSPPKPASSDVTDAGNGPRSNLPLGVPSGRVDELDQLGEKHGKLPPVESGSLDGGAKALSSTTTPTAAENEVDESEGQDGEARRATKRVRSDQNITSSKDEGER